MDSARNTSRLIALPALLALGLVASAHAGGTSAPAPTASGRMADTVTVLAPVKVEADRRRETSRGSATSVRIDRAQIARFQPLTTADALLSAPGVDLTRTGPWASRVSVRGLSGERVLVLVDGVRLQSGRGHGAQTSLISVDRLESVQVDPGAGGAMSGSDALGGVVQLTTHRDLLARERSLGLTLATHGADPGEEWSSLARLRYRSRAFGAELSGGLGGLTALVTPDGRVAHSGHREQEVAARIEARLGEATLDVEHQRHAAFHIGLPAFNSAAGSQATYPLQARDADRLEFALPASGARPLLKVLAVQQRFRTDYDEVTADSAMFRGRLIAIRTTDALDRITTWSRGVQPSIEFGALRLNGEWRHESTTGPRATATTVRNAAGTVTSSTNTSGESIPPARRDVLSAAALTTLSLPWSARVDLGVRDEWMHSRADSTANSFTSALDVTDRRMTGEAGISMPVSGLTPYARVATGFRSPNLEERYFNDSVHGGMRVFGNPQLRAERSTTVEGGVRAADLLGGIVREARVSAYRSEVTDLVSLQYLELVFGVPHFQYRNIARARLEGAEAQLAFQFGDVRVQTDVAAPRGHDLATGKPITDIGAARANLEARWLVPGPLHDAQLAVRARWTDASGKGDPNVARPAFWTGAVELGFTARQTRITATVRNVTGTRYREPMSFIPEAGRSVVLSLRRDVSFALPGASSKGVHR